MLYLIPSSIQLGSEQGTIVVVGTISIIVSVTVKLKEYHVLPLYTVQGFWTKVNMYYVYVVSTITK